MPTGVVKWFNESKGFGFVTPDEGGNDIFAHFSDISGQGFRTLREGQRIEYDLKDGPKGPQAANIRSLDPEPARPPKREFSDRPPREYSDRPPRTYGDRPPGPPGDRPARPPGDRPPRQFGDRPPRRDGATGGPGGGGTGSYGDRPPRTPWGAPVRDPGSFGGAGGGEQNFNDRKAPPRRFNERPKKDHERGSSEDE
jgi:cold shock protein